MFMSIVRVVLVYEIDHLKTHFKFSTMSDIFVQYTVHFSFVCVSSIFYLGGMIKGLVELNTRLNKN